MTKPVLLLLPGLMLDDLIHSWVLELRRLLLLLELHALTMTSATIDQ